MLMMCAALAGCEVSGLMATCHRSRTLQACNSQDMAAVNTPGVDACVLPAAHVCILSLLSVVAAHVHVVVMAAVGAVWWALLRGSCGAAPVYHIVLLVWRLFMTQAKPASWTAKPCSESCHVVKLRCHGWVHAGAAGKVGKLWLLYKYAVRVDGRPQNNGVSLAMC